MTCLHLLLLNLVQRGQLAVLCLLTPGSPALPVLCSPAGMQGIGTSHWAGSKLVFSELQGWRRAQPSLSVAFPTAVVLAGVVRSIAREWAHD